MEMVRPASFRVTAQVGVALDVSWASGIAVPAGVQVDVVDLGWRSDIVVSSPTETVGVIGDLRTGDRALVANAQRSSLVEFALEVFEHQRAAAGLVRGVVGDSSSLRLLAASERDAVWLPAGTSPA